MKVFPLILTGAILATGVAAQEYERGQVIDGITIVNVSCIKRQKAAADANCFASSTPIALDGSVMIYHSSAEVVLQANPGIEDFIVDGILPPMHMIATRVTE